MQYDSNKECYYSLKMDVIKDVEEKYSSKTKVIDNEMEKYL